MSTQIIEAYGRMTGSRATWMAGDFGQIARYTESEACRFVSRLRIPKHALVLDVACGTGNLAIAAARLAARVSGLDIAPNLLEQARRRARVEGLKIQFDEGDAEELPYGDASFDFVASIYGAMFAPRHSQVAAELMRVCRSRGVIAMANWTPTGFIGRMLKIVAAYQSLPSNTASPALWGDEDTVRERLRGGVSDLQLTRRIHHLRFPFSVPETIELFRLYYGPVYSTFEKLDAPGKAALRVELERLWTKHNLANERSTHVEAEYLEVIAQRA